MGGHVEAITGGEEHSTRRRATAEFASVASIDEPWKGGHAALRTYPSQDVGAIGHKRVEEGQVPLRDLSSAAVDGIAMADRERRELFAERGIGNGEVTA